MSGWEHEGPCDCAPGEGHRVDTSYCRHGTFVGDWAGPDYICGYCEMDDGDAWYAAVQRNIARAQALSPALARLVDRTWEPGLSEAAIQRLVTRIVRMSRWGVRLPADYQHPEPKEA